MPSAKDLVARVDAVVAKGLAEEASDELKAVSRQSLELLVRRAPHGGCEPPDVVELALRLVRLADVMPVKVALECEWFAECVRLTLSYSQARKDTGPHPGDAVCANNRLTDACIPFLSAMLFRIIKEAPDQIQFCVYALVELDLSRRERCDLSCAASVYLGMLLADRSLRPILVKARAPAAVAWDLESEPDMLLPMIAPDVTPKMLRLRRSQFLAAVTQSEWKAAEPWVVVAVLKHFVVPSIKTSKNPACPVLANVFVTIGNMSFRSDFARIVCATARTLNCMVCRYLSESPMFQRFSQAAAPCLSAVVISLLKAWTTFGDQHHVKRKYVQSSVMQSSSCSGEVAQVPAACRGYAEGSDVDSEPELRKKVCSEASRK